MLIKNTTLEYPVLKLLSMGKKSFEALGRLIKKSGDTIARMVAPLTDSYSGMEQVARKVFKKKDKLLLILDDTLIKKPFSQKMVGAWYFFDNKILRSIRAYKLLIAAVSDGKYIIPLRCTFMFAKELFKDAIESKDSMVIRIVKAILKIFPEKKFIVVVDGAFATIDFLKWCLDNNISAEMRMHSNRKVEYQGKSLAIKLIPNLRPKGRQMARTIIATWHGMPLHITAHRRIDKKGQESVVFQAATYAAKPSQHIQNYRGRWSIEKMIRTAKQSLTLQNCFSTKLDTQLNHMAAVLFAFSLAQLEMHRRHLKTPEQALRALNRKKFNFLKQYFYRSLASYY